MMSGTSDCTGNNEEQSHVTHSNETAASMCSEAPRTHTNLYSALRKAVPVA